MGSPAGPEDLASALDVLAGDLAAHVGVQFRVATTESERAEALRLRLAAVVEHAWAEGAAHDEWDAFDDRAVHVVGRAGEDVVCCGRLVLPPGPLPTEVLCGFVIEPAGRVVDVGRMVVVPGARAHRSGVFVALLASLYRETRTRGYEIGCGMMAPNVRGLLRQLGVTVDVLGPDRAHRGELRAPVRFDAAVHGREVLARWA